MELDQNFICTGLNQIWAGIITHQQQNWLSSEFRFQQEKGQGGQEEWGGSVGRPSHAWKIFKNSDNSIKIWYTVPSK